MAVLGRYEPRRHIVRPQNKTASAALTPRRWPSKHGSARTRAVDKRRGDGVNDATWNGRFGPHGRQYRAAADERRSSMRGLRQKSGARTALAEEGAEAAHDLADLVDQLGKPRAVWVMLPAGTITEQTVANSATCSKRATPSSTAAIRSIKDDIRRAEALKPKGIHYVDVGTSGGVWGLERGYCMMIGASKEVSNGSNRYSRRWRRAWVTSRRHPAAMDEKRGRAGLYPCRSDRRRSFREDDSQRHRIRSDAGLCRGLRHPVATWPMTAFRKTGVINRSAGYRRSVAARERDPVLASRPDRLSPRPGRRTRGLLWFRRGFR